MLRARWPVHMEVYAPLLSIMEETVTSEFQISAYPKGLALFLRERWQAESGWAGAPLPDPKALESIKQFFSW